MNKGSEKSSRWRGVNRVHADYKVIHIVGFYRFYSSHIIDFAIIIMAQLFA